MKKSRVTILVIIFFLLGILIDRSLLYYEMGEKSKIMLIEQESIKDDYKVLIQQFEDVKYELQLRKIQDSIDNADTLFVEDSILIEHKNL